jgi:hypothetical protein
LKKIFFILTILFSFFFFISCSKKKGIVSEKQISPFAKRVSEKLNNGDIELIAWMTEPIKPRHGESFKLVTYWKFNKPLKKGWKLFYHFENVDGSDRFIFDHYILDGNLKNSDIKSGDIVRDDANISKLPQFFNSDKLYIYTGFFKGNKRTVPEKKFNDGKNRLKLPVVSIDEPNILHKKMSVYAIAGKSRKQIKIDGKLNESFWKNASKSNKFWLSSGKSVAPIQTTVLTAMDDKNLYVAFQVEDHDIYATLKNTDDPLYDHDDVVEVFIDANGDRKIYYEMQISALGVKFDTKYNGRRKNRDDKWDSKIKYAVSCDGTLNNPKDKDNGWIVEMAIPFTSIKDSLHTPPADGDVWKVFFYRINRYSNKKSTGKDFTAWQPPYQGDFHNLKMMGELIFTYEEIL